MEVKFQLEELAMCLEYGIYDDCVIRNLIDVMKSKNYMIRRETNDYYKTYLDKVIRANKEEILKHVSRKEDEKFITNQLIDVDDLLNELNTQINEQIVQKIIKSISSLVDDSRNIECMKLFNVIIKKKKKFFELMKEKESDELYEALAKFGNNNYADEAYTLIKDLIEYEERKGIPGEIFYIGKNINELNKVKKITLKNKKNQSETFTYNLIAYTTIYEIKYLLMIEKEVALEKIKLYYESKELANSDNILEIESTLDFSYEADYVTFDTNTVYSLLKEKYENLSTISKKSFLSSINHSKINTEIISSFFENEQKEYTIDELYQKIQNHSKNKLIYHLLFMYDNNNLILRNEDISKLKRIKYFNSKNGYKDLSFVIFNSFDIKECNIETTLLYYHIQKFDLIEQIDNIWLPKTKEKIMNEYIKITFSPQYDVNQCSDYLKSINHRLIIQSNKKPEMKYEDSLRVQNIVLFLFTLYEDKTIEKKEEVKKRYYVLKGTVNYYIEFFGMYKAIGKNEELYNNKMKEIKLLKNDCPVLFSVIVKKIILLSKNDEFIYDIFTTYINNSTQKIIQVFVQRDSSFLLTRFFKKIPDSNYITFYEDVIVQGIKGILSKKVELNKFLLYLLYYSYFYNQRILLKPEQYRSLIGLMIEAKDPYVRLTLYYFLFQQMQEPEQYIFFTKIQISNIIDSTCACISLFNYLLYTLDKEKSTKDDDVIEKVIFATENHLPFKPPQISNVNNTDVNKPFKIYEKIGNSYNNTNSFNNFQFGLFILDDELSFLLIKCKDDLWIRFSTYFEFISINETSFNQLLNGCSHYYLTYIDKIELSVFPYDFYNSFFSIKDEPYKTIYQSLVFMDFSVFSFYSITNTHIEMSEKVEGNKTELIKNNSYAFNVKLKNKGLLTDNDIKTVNT